jgi:DNA invertase Pin-like site-specific DNA recombinase
VTDSRHLDPEPDLLLVVIQRVRHQVPALTDEQAQAIEAATRAELGGLRVRIPKRRKHPTDEQRHAIVREAITATDTDAQITDRHGIGRATLYRYLKRGTGP